MVNVNVTKKVNWVVLGIDSNGLKVNLPYSLKIVCYYNNVVKYIDIHNDNNGVNIDVKNHVNAVSLKVLRLFKNLLPKTYNCYTDNTWDYNNAVSLNTKTNAVTLNLHL